MDVLYRYAGLEFVWDARKAAINVAKHAVRFEQACEVFFDPFATVLDAGDEVEPRNALLGQTERGAFLFVVRIEREKEAIVSSRRGPQPRRNGETMKTMRDRLKVRLNRNRPMTTISLRMPEDVIEDLKEIAPMLGFSGYQPLMRSYIGQGLRTDLNRLSGTQVEALTASLRKQGVPDEQISVAIAEAGLKTA